MSVDARFTSYIACYKSMCVLCDKMTEFVIHSTLTTPSPQDYEWLRLRFLSLVRQCPDIV